jgi:hypothetical protein
MLSPFFALAMLAPNRQRSFRRAVVLHVLFCAAVVTAVVHNPTTLPVGGQMLLIAGIVEGATLVGWRLTQLPKSQALEFLLVSPVQPRRLFLLEAGVGVARLALITLAGLPVLGLLIFHGDLIPTDLLALVLMPLTWGAITGIGLTTWAYEPRLVRRWGEAVCLLLIVGYLAGGVLAGEQLGLWLEYFPAKFRYWFLELFVAFHAYNPFAVLQYWLEPHHSAEIAWERMAGLEIAAVGVVGLLLVRAGGRLKGHFHDRHYRPLTEVTPSETAHIGNRPLAWWAVRRVLEYSGRVNIWLAGGFGLIYAAYTVAGDHWPPYLGRLIFRIVESAGGLPMVATGLTLLAAVPAAFQYGLWDSSTQDRCRRLELLLMTHLGGHDYYDAAAAAAWRRGRAYFFIACLLWLAAVIAGQASIGAALAAVVAAVLLWGCYFAFGFRAFARGAQANGLGTFLTLGLPFAAFLLARAGLPSVAALTPPGAVYWSLADGSPLNWICGALFMGIVALVLGKQAMRNCDNDLRAWYDANHGQKASVAA